jgi:hypothetical protein
MSLGEAGASLGEAPGSACLKVLAGQTLHNTFCQVDLLSSGLFAKLTFCQVDIVSS